jgi:hypothetical protein
MLQASSTSETRSTARELKFLVTPADAAAIRQWARVHLGPDPFAGGEFNDEYATTSLYCDTPELDVYHRRGSYKRSKYRIRRYGHESLVFLERKLRTGTTLSKRRTTIDITSLPKLLAPPDRAWEGYWFQQRLALRRLRVTCQVSYVRVARVAASPKGTIRLTIDRDIHAIPQTSPAFTPERGADVSVTHHILELKFRRELPDAFQELIDRFGLAPLTVSKYRLALEALSRRGDGLARAFAPGALPGEASLPNA